MISFSSLSQVDTTKMSFPTNTVRLIYKDLLKGDKCEAEKTYLYSQIDLYENKLSEKDSLIFGYKKLDENNQFIIKNDSIQKEAYKSNESLFKKQIKQANIKKTFWFTTTLVTTAISIFLITKL